MRKVTALAVILTALTGCSQSTGIPSTQWSFKVPSAEGISGSQVGLDEGSSSVVSVRSVGDQAGGKATTGRQMGPAFEQAGANAAANTSDIKRSATNQSGNKKSSRPSAQAFSLTKDLSTFQTLSRPDPIAQVRAYLRSSSPTALANRMPYRSDVYLSSQPTSAPSYALPTPIAEPTVNAVSPNYPSASYPSVDLPSINLPPTGLSSTDLSSAESVTSRSNYTSDYASDYASGYTGLPVLNTLPSDDVSSYTALSPSAYALPAYPSNTYPNAGEASRSSDDGLPQLAPAISSGPTAPVSVSQVTEQVPKQAASAPQPSENVSIGTAMLRDIESKAAESKAAESKAAESKAAESKAAENKAATDSAESAAAEISQPQQPQQLQIIGARPNSSSGELTYQISTLSRLTQTMPPREISPLVVSFRTSSSLSEQPLSEPADELPASFENQISENQSGAPVLNLKPGLRPHGSSSPLLEGFDADRVTDGVIESSAQSAIYVPIATTTPLDSSVILIQTALNSLNKPKDIEFNAFNKLSAAELAVRKEKARRAAITLAAQQTSQRRQRLNWL